MTRYYDSLNNRLVYCEQVASPDFWDSHWRAADFEKAIRSGSRFVTRWTRQYLPAGSRVLEGGCGRGQNVYALRQAGYGAFGVDFAYETVSLVNRYAPELDVRKGDVRNLPFEDGFFDGYWSLGVIEHFYQGYGPILREMARVLRGGGYLFLTFPRMSFLRKMKAQLGHYPVMPVAFDPEGSHFYQFALDTENVIDALKLAGFRLIAETGYAGLKGFKDEAGPLKPFLQRIYNSSSLGARMIKVVAESLLNPWCGHSALLVLRKEPSWSKCDRSPA